MIKRFLNFFRRSARLSQSVPESQLALTRTRVGDTSLVRINVDDWGPDTQQALHALAAKHANLTFYDGKVQHGYALSHVATWTQCPRCHANTQQHYTNVIYATQTALRVLFAPFKLTLGGMLEFAAGATWVINYMTHQRFRLPQLDEHWT